MVERGDKHDPEARGKPRVPKTPWRVAVVWSDAKRRPYTDASQERYHADEQGAWRDFWWQVENGKHHPGWLGLTVSLLKGPETVEQWPNPLPTDSSAVGRSEAKRHLHAVIRRLPTEEPSDG